MKKRNSSQMNFFEKYLTIWVLMCMGIGILLGHFLPMVSNEMNNWKIAEISIPIAILIWLMIYPVMLKIDFKKVFSIKKSHIKGIGITTFVNWAIKPFTMYGIAMLFFKVFYVNILDSNISKDYISGLIILAAAPCTAMIFVWSKLVKGDPNFTLGQAIINDTLLMIIFIPIVGALLHASNVSIPWDTLGYSILIFIVIPLFAALLTRFIVNKISKSKDFLQSKIIAPLDKITMIILLMTLVLIFMFQTDNIIENPIDILLIMVPIIIQVFITFSIAFLMNFFLKVKFEIAGPSSTIAASNFFELALVVTMALYGPGSSEALAVMVGIIVEVPLMLILVKIINKSHNWYEKNLSKKNKKVSTN